MSVTIMLQVILNQLKVKAEELLAEDSAIAYSLTSIKLTVLYRYINTRTPPYTHTHLHTEARAHAHQSPIKTVIRYSEKYNTHARARTHTQSWLVNIQNTNSLKPIFCHPLSISLFPPPSPPSPSHSLSPHPSLPSSLSAYISPHLKINKTNRSTRSKGKPGWTGRF